VFVFFFLFGSMSSPNSNEPRAPQNAGGQPRTGITYGPKQPPAYYAQRGGSSGAPQGQLRERGRNGAHVEMRRLDDDSVEEVEFVSEDFLLNAHHVDIPKYVIFLLALILLFAVGTFVCTIVVLTRQ
jgi:hypothetical protein